MLVSYVVTFFNKFEFIPSLIRSIEAQAGDFDKELIIADDGSTAEQLAELNQFVSQFNKYPIVVVPSAENTGPAQCFNRSLEAVSGEVVVAIDADDVFAPDATSYYLNALKTNQADFVYGRRRVEGHKKANNKDFKVIDDPLDYVIKNNIVHMSFAAKTELLRAVGGADPRLFIQDQSLPFRLAYGAKRMVRSEVVTVFVNSSEAGLSKNVAQQHYDRFWMVMNLIDDHPELSTAEIAGLKDIARSALWKMDRDLGSSKLFSRHFWTYLIGRVSGIGPSVAFLKISAETIFQIDEIRRVEPET